MSRNYNRAELRYNWVAIKNEYISYSFYIYYVEWNIGPYEHFNTFSTHDKETTHIRQTVSEAIVY